MYYIKVFILKCSEHSIFHIYTSSNTGFFDLEILRNWLEDANFEISDTID